MKRIDLKDAGVLLIAVVIVFPSVVTDRAGLVEEQSVITSPPGWGDDARLTIDDSDSWYPSLAVDGNNIHVTWQDNRDGINEIYYKRSIDNGETWSNDTRLTIADSDSYAPSLAVDGNNIHVTWVDDRDDGISEIYYKRSIDNGETWSNDTRLTIDDPDSYAPSLAVDGNNIHVTWVDNRDDSISEIYYKRSIDNGETWGDDIRLTIDDSYSRYPSLAVDVNNIHVTWVDNRDGNYEIYYKHKKNLPPSVEITKPIKALYLFNFQIRKFLFRIPLIIGRITIEADATDGEPGIDRVEFYINGKLKGNDTSYPYEFDWRWTRPRLIHLFIIKVVAYDYSGNTAVDKMIVRKIL
jgi:hypothetical protein